MKKGAQYLLNCQKVENKGGNDDGLLCGGKDKDGNYLSWRWTHDNCYGYWALKAASKWAIIEGEKEFTEVCNFSARKILEGMEKYLYDSKNGVWQIAIDKQGNHLKNPHLVCVLDDKLYPSWIQYSPVMLNLPFEKKDLFSIERWIHNTFQGGDGSCYELCCENGEIKLRKYPGLSFQASLAWLNIGNQLNKSAALKWALESGLWHKSGGWIDWIEISPDQGKKAEEWMRFIDTSFYYIACLTNYKFGL